MGVDLTGRFYWVGEGDEDEGPIDTATPITIFWRERKFWGSPGGKEGRFFRFALDIDPGDNELTISFVVDDQPELSHSTTVSGLGRREFRAGLPEHMWGRYIDVSIASNSVVGRVLYYDVRFATVDTEDF